MYTWNSKQPVFESQPFPISKDLLHHPIETTIYQSQTLQGIVYLPTFASTGL